MPHLHIHALLALLAKNIILIPTLLGSFLAATKLLVIALKYRS